MVCDGLIVLNPMLYFGVTRLAFGKYILRWAWLKFISYSLSGNEVYEFVMVSEDKVWAFVYYGFFLLVIYHLNLMVIVDPL